MSANNSPVKASPPPHQRTISTSSTGATNKRHHHQRTTSMMSNGSCSEFPRGIPRVASLSRIRAHDTSRHDLTEAIEAQLNNESSSNPSYPVDPETNAAAQKLMQMLIERRTDDLDSEGDKEESSRALRHLAQASVAVLGGVDKKTEGEADEEEDGCDKCALIYRQILGICMVLITIAVIVIVLASFAATIEDSPATGVGLFFAYFACSIGTAWLEGGQGARFQAYGSPPAMFNDMPQVKRFIVKDEEDPNFINQYASIRQQATLATTTVNGALILPLMKTYDGWGGDKLLFVCHLLLTTIVFQVLPQIRANRVRTYINSWGILFTYYFCEIVSKVFDPSMPAELLNNMITWLEEKVEECCCGADDEEEETVAEELEDEKKQKSTTEKTEPLHEGGGGGNDGNDDNEDQQGEGEEDVTVVSGSSRKPSKFRSDLAKWPAPEVAAQNVGHTTDDSDLSPAFAPPCAPNHIAPHIVLAMMLHLMRRHPLERKVSEVAGSRDKEQQPQPLSTFEKSVRLLLNNI